MSIPCTIWPVLTSAVRGGFQGGFGRRPAAQFFVSIGAVIGIVVTSSLNSRGAAVRHWARFERMKNGSMRAVGVVPARREVAMFGQARPSLTAPTEGRIRTIEVGICGTDREICSFAYGTPPDGSEYLV